VPKRSDHVNTVGLYVVCKLFGYALIAFTLSSFQQVNQTNVVAFGWVFMQYGKVSVIEEKFQELERAPDESRAEEDRVGCSLKDNNDVVACRADYLYHRGEFQRCYDTTKAYFQRPHFLQSVLYDHKDGCVP
jgi:hypothetical protein